MNWVNQKRNYWVSCPLLVTVVLLLQVGTLYSQSRFYPWSINLHAGISEYSGDLGNGFFEFNLKREPFYSPINGVHLQDNSPGIGGVHINRYLNKYIDLSFQYFHGEWGYHNAEKTQFFHCRMNIYDAMVFWKILPDDERVFHPYFLLGVGYRNVKIPGSGGQVDHTWELPVGLGLRVRTSNRTQITWQTNFAVTGSDVGDGKTGLDPSNHDLALNHTIGFGILFLSFQKGTTKNKCPRF